MLDILALIPRKKRSTPSGWITFNAICCQNLGHKPDTRSRGGVKMSGLTGWAYSCFNCQFKCGYQLGRAFSPNLRLLLSWCGLDKQEIDKLSFENFRHQSAGDAYVQHQIIALPDFKEKELPEKSRPLDPNKDIEHVAYLNKRGLSHQDYPFYVVDGEERKRIIIPYFYKGKIVGNTSRYYENIKFKYISDQQPGYVFNVDAQKPYWQVCIVVEGQFDAISVNGCAYMGSNINDTQAAILKRLYRKIIVVPDRDKAGLEVCDVALEHGFQVSIPEWAEGIKDVNDAVVKYGRLPTVLSILQNATSSRIVTEMRKKKLA